MRSLRHILALVLIGAAAGTSHGQLRQEQVLVVYDSRIPDSKSVAEYYAGSAKVPGGAGGMPGVHPKVLAFDLETTGIGPSNISGAYIDRPAWRQRLRDPIRQYLTTNALTNQVRCIVLTKGIPHLLGDINSFGIGDQPVNAATAFSNGNYTAASVDSELVLLWQNLDSGEAGGPGDSKADGAIFNPYWGRTQPIEAWPTVNTTVAKNFTTPSTAPPSGPGAYWTALPPNQITTPTTTHTTPGDIYLVCRLDGRTVAHTKAMIDRAQGIVIDVATATVVIDEADSNGLADPASNGEYDNEGIDALRGGDDYEQARDLLVSDGRYRRGPTNTPPSVAYNGASGAANFTVGPLIPYNGEGIVVSTPVIMLAHFGANHAGAAPGEGVAVNPPARSSYAESFNYAPGAVFNTMESYNGRDFQGVGTLFGQEQASDFLASGGTFAIGHTWEPLAALVPDNLLLARNYLLGNLSWAEAAWSSIPVLSWQHIVVGDPLGRAVRTSDDRDGNGKISVEDLYAWHAMPADVNNSGAADNTDRTLVEAAVRAGERANMKGRQRP